MHKKSDGYIGPSDISISDGKMTPEVLLSLGRLSDPQLSPDGEKILFGVTYTSIADNSTCRNLFVCNTDGNQRARLTEDGKSIGNARWAADGKHIYYIQDGQIWKGKISGKGTNLRLADRKQLSDVKAEVSGFILSPDQSKILYVSSVHSNVVTPEDTDPKLDKARAYMTDDLMYRHWDHWVTEIPHSFVADIPDAEKGINGKSSTDILESEDGLYELPMEPFAGIEQLCWSPDGKYIAYSCKKSFGKKYAFSTDSEIYIYNIKTKGTGVIPMKGGYDTDPAWSPDGKKIAWLSMARNGYESDKSRLMVADVDYDPNEDIPVITGIRDVTSGFIYNASSPVWDKKSDAVYFNALAEGLQGIFRADVNAADISKAVTRITGEDKWFDFQSPFAVRDDSNGNTQLLTSYYSMEFPSELVSVTVSKERSDTTSDNETFTTTDPVNGNRIIKVLKGDCPVTDRNVTYSRITHENDHIISKLKTYKTEARIMKTVDGKDMLTWVLYPPEFDSTKVYPSILITLGGPQGTLSQDWSYRWCYRLMAAQGYVVVLPNRRGTTAFGPEWTEEISGDYIGLNMQDYLSAAKQMKAEPFIGKMAACGASYGGYSVYYLAGIHGNVFDCFIAHAGIFDESHMYLTTEEMWFPNWDNGGLEEYEADPAVGTPECPVGPKGDGETFGGIRQGGSQWSNAPKAVRHYANSPDKLVKNWHTPILCIHGGNDFRVPYDQGMAAFNAAQLMGVPSRLIIFPDECHWIQQPQNALFWHREYFAWLDKWCK
ncbi:MAG: prolyl oligopeptidase family serine peptidase [Bacteroidales bacterium]|nr:prolyl oligopeptidase family serine peptidase [Bacteroidales bacterium]